MSHNVIDFNPYKTSTVQQHQLGRKWTTEDGDIYRYAKAGAAITAGKLQVCPAPKTNHHNVTVQTAAAIGDKTVTVTLGATLAAVDEYAGGTLVINDVTGEGGRYKITGHPAADSAATLELTLERPLVEALDTTTQIELNHNTWNGVVEAAVEERKPAGVPLVDVASGSYAWLLTRGVTGVLAGDTINIGEEVVSHASTAGAVDADSTTYGTGFAYYKIGKQKVAATSTEFNSVELTID